MYRRKIFKKKQYSMKPLFLCLNIPTHYGSAPHGRKTRVSFKNFAALFHTSLSLVVSGGLGVSFSFVLRRIGLSLFNG